MKKRPYLKTLDNALNPQELGAHEKAVLILHDQLNLSVWPDWIQREKPLLIFIESTHKGRSLPYHKKKLIYVLSSMRHFALEMQESGFPVHYIATSDSYGTALQGLLDENRGMYLTYMKPSEWDSREQLRKVHEQYPDRVDEIENGFFFADPADWTGKIEPGYRMEYFYREMRRKTGYLMNGDQPVGGEWNYDEYNREKLPPNYPIPPIPRYDPDDITEEVVSLITDQFNEHFGKAEGFGYAVTRDHALELLEDFIENRLKDFGPYEDALATGEPFLFHSHLSLYMNNGLLTPREVCERVLQAYEAGKAPIHSVEGFIRQVLGWREFVRIYYEALMPEIRETNEMNFTESLPQLFWDGETEMKCMQEAVDPVIEHGYSHHIQRLMVLSNFSNLTKTDPRKLFEWFWFAYVDAYEWVVLPNVLGMSTFADGGVLASKPYVSSGNYINKMSDYCKKCPYSISKKTGEKACPFNYLYWNFVDEQREFFSDSGRVNFMVNMYEKKSDEQKRAIRESSERFLEQLPRYEQSGS